MNNEKKVLVLFSGGLDSTCMLLDCIDRHDTKNIFALSFEYGQRHWEKENAAAKNICKRFNIFRKVLKIPLADITVSDSLTNKRAEITPDTNTAVQLRNMIFLTFAASYAIENGCTKIFHGVCKGDNEKYRDTQSEFYKFLQIAIQAGISDPRWGSYDIKEDLIYSCNIFGNDNKIQGDVNISEGYLDVQIDTPFINYNKEDVLARILRRWGTDIIKDTWTCYNGGIGKYNGKSCGTCSACRERLAAFNAVGIKDPIEYYMLKKIKNKLY